MAVRTLFARRKPLLALAIGFLAFSVLAAADIPSSKSHGDTPVGNLTVPQIEEQLQVRMAACLRDFHPRAIYCK